MTETQAISKMIICAKILIYNRAVVLIKSNRLHNKDNSCAVISAILACKIRKATYFCLTESAGPFSRTLNRADTERERERGVCAR